MRQHVALPSRPVLTACLPALCHPCCREACALFQRPSLDRALEQRGATLVPVGTPRRYQSGQCRPTVLFRVSCSCYFLSVRKPSTCLPTCSFLSPSAISLPRPFAHSLARQNAQRAALPATKAGRRTVVCASVPVYDDHISQLHGPRSDNTGETRATPTLCDCLLDGARSHALGGGEAAPVIGTKRISCRPPGPLDGLAASMLAVCRCQ